VILGRGVRVHPLAELVERTIDLDPSVHQTWPGADRDRETYEVASESM
jgi:hypothetical protein